MCRRCERMEEDFEPLEGDCWAEGCSRKAVSFRNHFCDFCEEHRSHCAICLNWPKNDPQVPWEVEKQNPYTLQESQEALMRLNEQTRKGQL